MGNSILSALVPTVVVHCGVFLVAGVLPVFSFYVIDGVVALLRGRGVKLLLMAIGIVAVIAVGGALAWQWGLDQLLGTPSFPITSAGAEANAKFFVGWAIALGAIGFLARMVKLAMGKKKRT